jgi:hypothetical protein
MKIGMSLTCREKAKSDQNCLLSSVFWVLSSGFWVLGSGFWVLGSGFWVLGSHSRPPTFRMQFHLFMQINYRKSTPNWRDAKLMKVIKRDFFLLPLSERSAWQSDPTFLGSRSAWQSPINPDPGGMTIRNHYAAFDFMIHLLSHSSIFILRLSYRECIVAYRCFQPVESRPGRKKSANAAAGTGVYTTERRICQEGMI